MNRDNQTYHQKAYIHQTLRLRDMLKTLPPFAKDYFRSIEPHTSAKTRISYAYDIRVFFNFLLSENPAYRGKSMQDFRVDDLDRITSLDIEEYLEYLKVYRDPNSRTVTNTEKGLARKMSSLRSFYAYYFKMQMIRTNPTVLVDMPKLHEKAIVRLEPDEVASLLDLIDKGSDKLKGQALAYYRKTRQRDLAIATLLLGTGLRVSECVGLDLADVDFKNNSVKVVRKGGNEMIVYFGPEVEQALRDYIDGDRKKIEPAAGHENALFYSLQRKRIGVQAIENMIKKYALQVTPNKHITPHKLRSTYGTTLYRETGDIYLVADVLGHKDVNTTRKHYAAIDENRRRKAAGVVQLRDN